MGFPKSNADHTKKISQSVFVTNFPDSTNSSDLWKVCSAYGTMIDVFIPDKKAKSGKRFAFVLFEFDKEDTKANLMQHTGVKSCFHIIRDAEPDFVSDERIVWMDIEGVPLHVWSRETFTRIGYKWGEVVDLEDNGDSFFGRKRLCIKTKHVVSILEAFKIIIKGKVFKVHAKELFSCNPIFLPHKEMVISSDDESVHSKFVQSWSRDDESSGKGASDDEEISETIFDDNSPFPNHYREMGDPPSQDLFKIYDLLTHPPGFTPDCVVSVLLANQPSRPGESMCFSDFPACFQTFMTLCLLNYALMIRHDYDLTSSLRRGALHSAGIREPRTRTKPLRFQDERNMAAYAFSTAEEEDTHEPLTYQEAVVYEDSSKYKARLEARKFTQRAGYELEQIDVKKTFLHENLEEVIYMRQPSGYEQGNKVCLLKKSLYGLKQSPRQWYKRFDEYMLSNGFKRSSYDNCVYYKSYAPGEYIYLLLYVDDILTACKSKAEIGSTKSLLKKEFNMKELRGSKEDTWYGDRQGVICKCGWELNILDGVHEARHRVYGPATVGLVYGTGRGNHVDVTGFVDSKYAKDPDNESPKIATSRRVVFNESVMYKDTLKDFGACTHKSIEILQTPDLTYYQLVREPRTRTKSLRFQDERNMAAYAFSTLDVKTTFLHENLEEVIYMRRPSGYEQDNKVCLSKKSLYGLMQSPRQWYKMFDEYMLRNGFKRSCYDNCVYYKNYAPGEYIYLLLYVDDMLTGCKSKAEIGSTKSLLKNEFNMKELGEAKKILGMKIVRDRSHKILRVSQSGYVSKILNNFKIDNEKSVQMSLGEHFKPSLKDYPVRDCDVERMSKVSYVNAVGSLIYLMVCTRPDIKYAVSVDSSTWVCCKLEGNATTRDDSVNYRCEVYGPYGCCEGSHLVKRTLEELGVELNTVAVNCDNQGVIHLSRNNVFHEKTKHINVRYHFISEVLEVKTVKVLKVGTKHNVADALTNVRTRINFLVRVGFLPPGLYKKSLLLTYEVQGIRLGKVGLSARNHQDTVKVGKHDSKSVPHGLVGKGETSNSSTEYSKHWKKEVISEQHPDVIDIAEMDYTPARKKSPIHN
nr:retrovirus-related Pol polyprotein from transposon TNT 1-94 [Tanacetum cinerariifolium]